MPKLPDRFSDWNEETVVMLNENVAPAPRERSTHPTAEELQRAVIDLSLGREPRAPSPALRRVLPALRREIAEIRRRGGRIDLG